MLIRMRRPFVLASAGLLVACLCAALPLAFAQPAELPPPFPRKNATKLLENDRLNVWDIVWPNGEPTGLHRHIYDQVGTYYARGGRTITTPDGEARRNMTEVGALSTTRMGTTHIEEGNTDPPLRAVFIELKHTEPSGLPAASVPASTLPSAAAKQVLDDERVTAWDVTWSAQSGVTVTATRETVIVWLAEGSARSTRDGTSTTLPVKAGTMRHLERGSTESIAMVAGSPRAIVFQLK